MKLTIQVEQRHIDAYRVEREPMQVARALDAAIAEALGVPLWEPRKPGGLLVGFTTWHRSGESDRHPLPQVAIDWLTAAMDDKPLEPISFTLDVPEVAP